jgi:nicotinate-nucleotide adenylyltransferase
MRESRIGVYGGTFDPIHVGHLAAAEAVREAFGLARVLFLPNWRQPLKPHDPAATPASRWAMVTAAIAGNEFFAASAIELEQEKPSFSIDTLDALRQLYPDTELRFLLGVDAANQLADWRRPERVLAEYHPIVLRRGGRGGLDWDALERIRPDARRLVTVAKVPALDISSSEIRTMVAARRSIRYLVPEVVRDIIEEERLYQLDG